MAVRWCARGIARTITLAVLLRGAPVLANEEAPDEGDANAPAAETSAEEAESEPVAESEQEEGPEEPSPPRMVTVHIESNKTVELQMVEPSGAWRTVCESPCDIELSAEETYRIDGSGVRTSSSFKLDGAAGNGEPGAYVVIQVDAGSSTAHGLGVAATVVGATPVLAAAGVAVGGAAALGVVVIVICPFVAVFGGDFGECAGYMFKGAARSYGKAITHPVVASVLGGGVVLGVTGIVLMSSNSSTDVNVGPGTRRAAFRLREEEEPFLRLTEEMPLPRVATIPIVSGSF